MKGTPESVSAAEAATIARMSGSFSMSCDSTVTMTWVSLRQPSTNSGRIGRSIRRETSVSFSVGRPSRLKIAAGNAAGGVGLFLVVDGQREEVEAGLGLLGGDDGGEHGGLAVGGEHGAVGLAGDLAGFERRACGRPSRVLRVECRTLSSSSSVEDAKACGPCRPCRAVIGKIARGSGLRRQPPGDPAMTRGSRIGKRASAAPSPGLWVGAA